MLPSNPFQTLVKFGFRGPYNIFAEPFKGPYYLLRAIQVSGALLQPLQFHSLRPGRSLCEKYLCQGDPGEGDADKDPRAGTPGRDTDNP